MEPDWQHFRAMIFYYFKNGLNQAPSLERLTQFSVGLRSLRGVELLLKMKRGVGDRWRQLLKANIDAIEKMLREDAHVTYTDIEASLRIGSGSVAKIQHIYLRVSKVSSRWMPQSHWRSEGHSSGIVAVKCFGDSTMGTLAAILRSLQVTRPGFTSVIQKQSVTRRSGCSLMMIDLSKWKEQKVLGRKWCSLSLLQVVMGNKTTRASKDSDCTVVHHSCPPTGSPKISRKAPKSCTEGHPVAPCQCLCPCYPFDNGFSEGDSCAAVVPSSLRSRPGTWVTSFCSLRGRPDCVGSSFQNLKTQLQHTKGSSMDWMTVLRIVDQEDAT